MIMLNILIRTHAGNRQTGLSLWFKQNRIRKVVATRTFVSWFMVKLQDEVLPVMIDYDRVGGRNTQLLVIYRVFRDTSAWYHLL